MIQPTSQSSKVLVFFFAPLINYSFYTIALKIPSNCVEVKKATDGPVLIGSGVTIDNIEDYLSSDALIIGSHFKNAGSWKNQVNQERVNDFMRKFENLRNGNRALP